ncbi:uncharacterized protein [Amphiura filiformis]|uniref:uncharacterized protein n=1 Tax=Amphiura filiformis TaxID=82378 RepID=UPI003B210176
MLWCCILVLTISIILSAWPIEAQYGYQVMPQPMMMAPQPAVMVPQPMGMPMGYGGMQQPGYGGGQRGYGGGGGGSVGGGVQKGPWSECSKTCGADSYRTRTYTPCDTSRSSCTEKEGCIVPECGKTKIFKAGDKIKVPCHVDAGQEGFKAQWFTYEDKQNTWKYVTLESDRKYLDEKKNLVIASAEVRDQGTYRCNLQSREGTIVAESIWHFTVKKEVNEKAAGGGGAAAAIILIIIIVIICVVRCKKGNAEDGDGKNKASGGEEGGGYDFDFDY